MKKDPSSNFNFSEQQKAIMECSYRYEDDNTITESDRILILTVTYTYQNLVMIRGH